MALIWFILVHFSLCYSFPAAPPRLKRFLNSEVHNRINVLEQAHTAHREDSSSTRIIFFSVIGSISFIVIVIFLSVIFMCHRLRRITRERQTSALTALHTSGLPSLHPMAHVLFNTLQQLHTMERNTHPQPPSMNSNINPSFSNALKF